MNKSMLNEILKNYSPEELKKNHRLFLSLFESTAMEMDARIQSGLLGQLIENYNKMAKELKDSEQLYRSALAAMEEGIVVHSSTGEIITHNNSAVQILGLTGAQLLGKTPTDPGWRAIAQDGSPLPGDEHPAQVTLKTGAPMHGFIMGVYKTDGKLSWLSVNSQPVIHSGEETPAAVVVTFVDITERMSHVQELTRMSETDHLTKIANRLKFSTAAGREVNSSKRYDYPLSILMFDLDHFKRVNDTFGHDIGDIVLVDTVRAVEELIRETDVFARWGGEEFIILLPHSGKEDGAALGERIRAAVETWVYEEAGHITCSIGVTSLTDEDTEETLLKRVDDALYEAKNRGRNRVVTL